MYNIGQFSVICNINKKTLRYYDEIDLFKPAHVDGSNQYRYYEKHQIPVIKEILKLKDIGISLERIKSVISDKCADRINGVYLQRLDEIKTSIEKLKTQKRMIEVELRSPAPMDIPKSNYKIDQGYFIEEGYVYYNKIDADIQDIHPVIDDFYTNSQGINLSSGHIFIRSLEDNAEGFSQIFAYADASGTGQNIRFQPREMCIKIVCDDIKDREIAYINLFDFSKENSLNMGKIYEKYKIGIGKLNIEIMSSIK